MKKQSTIRRMIRVRHCDTSMPTANKKAQESNLALTVAGTDLQVLFCAAEPGSRTWHPDVILSANWTIRYRNTVGHLILEGRIELERMREQKSTYRLVSMTIHVLYDPLYESSDFFEV